MSVSIRVSTQTSARESRRGTSQSSIFSRCWHPLGCFLSGSTAPDRAAVAQPVAPTTCSASKHRLLGLKRSEVFWFGNSPLIGPTASGAVQNPAVTGVLFPADCLFLLWIAKHTARLPGEAAERGLFSLGVLWSGATVHGAGRMGQEMGGRSLVFGQHLRGRHASTGRKMDQSRPWA